LTVTNYCCLRVQET